MSAALPTAQLPHHPRDRLHRPLRALPGWLLASLLLWPLLISAAQAAPEAEPWPFWDASTADSTVRVDHSAWQALLDTYLVTLPDQRTAFRYAAVTGADKARLQDYLAALTTRDPRALNRDEQMAYWINLYNALTIQVVLDNPGKKSILRMGGGWLPRGPWDDTVAQVAGQALTLNDIEHRILRPIWQDHRIHFAVNCASIGCPNLAAAPYRGDTLETQLDSAEQAFLNHPRAVSLQGDKLTLSSLFDWYMGDFAPTRSELLAYLARQTGRTELKDYQGDLTFRYDWQLNAAP